MLLITPDEVLAYAFSPREKITPGSIRLAKIDVAQERFIRPVVGENMFESMTSGEYSSFVNRFVKPALAHYVRYGVIAEFSIRMGDDGAVLWEGGSVDDSSSKNSTENVNTARNQSALDKKDSYGNTDSETVLNQSSNTVYELEETRQYEAMKNTTEEKTTSSKETKTTETEITDDKKGVVSVTGSDIRIRKEYRPATDAQRNLIMRRALADADVLMAKAIRHLLRNSEKFPGFDPSEVRPTGIITGFSTFSHEKLWK